jgi:hypothetical protein
MPQVKLTAHLKKFFPDSRRSVEIDAKSVREVVTQLNAQFPGLGDYIVDEQGRLRRHVNIFVDVTNGKRSRQSGRGSWGGEPTLYCPSPFRRVSTAEIAKGRSPCHTPEPNNCWSAHAKGC